MPEPGSSWVMRLPACKRSKIIYKIEIFLLTAKIVELRGFEPLTSCMPCLAVSSDGIALSRIAAGQTDIGV